MITVEDLIAQTARYGIGHEMARACTRDSLGRNVAVGVSREFHIIDSNVEVPLTISYVTFDSTDSLVSDTATRSLFIDGFSRAVIEGCRRGVKRRKWCAVMFIWQGGLAEDGRLTFEGGTILMKVMKIDALFLIPTVGKIALRSSIQHDAIRRSFADGKSETYGGNYFVNNVVMSAACNSAVVSSATQNLHARITFSFELYRKWMLEYFGVKPAEPAPLTAEAVNLAASLFESSAICRIMAEDNLRGYYLCLDGLAYLKRNEMLPRVCLFDAVMA